MFPLRKIHTTTLALTFMLPSITWAQTESLQDVAGLLIQQNPTVIYSAREFITMDPPKAAH